MMNDLLIQMNDYEILNGQETLSDMYNLEGVLWDMDRRDGKLISTEDDFDIDFEGN